MARRQDHHQSPEVAAVLLGIRRVRVDPIVSRRLHGHRTSGVPRRSRPDRSSDVHMLFNRMGSHQLQ